jgi:Xaa-Pro aminopeptidase
MKYKSIPASFFIRNRERLYEQLAENSFLILYASREYHRNGDQFFPFRQNSDLYYLSGIDQEDTALVMVKDVDPAVSKSLLFIKKTDKSQQIWFGIKLNPEAASKKSGVDDVRYINKLDDVVKQLQQKYKQAYLWKPDIAKFDLENLAFDRNIQLAQSWENTYKVHNLFPLTQSLRLVKQKEELATMKKAISITRQGFMRVLQTLEPGMMEYEVEAELSYSFLKEGANGHAYAPIVAGGFNATILHYIDNDTQLQDGELLLMDFGAEYGNYAADCSRTIPVNGRFTVQQAKYYQAVLDVYKRTIKLFIPGNTIENINKQAGLWMQEKLLQLGLLCADEIDNYEGEQAAYFKYFMHGTSHFIGLDVHDVGTKTTPFKKNMILTCEPGLYIEEENLGIRIETNVRVDDEPEDLMSDFPVEIDEIEQAMVKE